MSIGTKIDKQKKKKTNDRRAKIKKNRIAICMFKQVEK